LRGGIYIYIEVLEKWTTLWWKK